MPSLRVAIAAVVGSGDQHDAAQERFGDRAVGLAELEFEIGDYQAAIERVSSAFSVLTETTALSSPELYPLLAADMRFRLSRSDVAGFDEADKRLGSLAGLGPTQSFIGPYNATDKKVA